MFQTIIQQIAGTSFQLWILRSEGYGLRVNEWGELLDSKERLLVDPAIFMTVSDGNEEWFYNVDAEVIVNKTCIRFGLHDTTALYIDAPKEISEKIVKLFRLVQIDKDN